MKIALTVIACGLLAGTAHAQTGDRPAPAPAEPMTHADVKPAHPHHAPDATPPATQDKRAALRARLKRDMQATKLAKPE